MVALSLLPACTTSGIKDDPASSEIADCPAVIRAGGL
jgi:hypothetical protein